MAFRGPWCLAGQGRRPVPWRVAVASVAGIATLSVGVGFAHADANTSRDQALRTASSQAVHMPSAKASIFMAGVERAFPTHPASKPASSARPSWLPSDDEPAPRVSGISNLKQAPFSQSAFEVKNAFYGMVGNRWYGVYVGTVGLADPAAAGQGGVYIVSADARANTNWRNLGPFPESGTSWLKITSYSGTTLTVTSNTGAMYRFDLSTLKYR